MVGGAGEVTVRIEFERGAAPVSGRLVDEAEAARPFAGWTELFAALQTAVGERPEAGEPMSRRGEG